MEINNKRRQRGSDDYCRKPGQSVFPGFPAALEHRRRGGKAKCTQSRRRHLRRRRAGGKNYFSSFHRFLTSLRNEKKALVGVFKFGRSPESHQRGQTRDRFRPFLSLSLPVFFCPSVWRAVLVPPNRFGGWRDGKNAVAHPIPCGNFSLRVFPIRPRRMAISPNEAFSRVVVVSQLYRVTLSRRGIKNRSVARKFAGFI